MVRILDGVRKRIEGIKADITPFKFKRYDEDNFIFYSDDVFTDENNDGNENLNHIFLECNEKDANLSNFRKYTEEGSITPEQQMNMIFEIARMAGCKELHLFDQARKKYAKKFYSISLHNLFMGKKPYYMRYGFMPDKPLPEIGDIAGYAKDLLPLLKEYKNKHNIIFYAEFVDGMRRFQYAPDVLLALILFCKAIQENDINKMTYIFNKYYTIMPKMAKRNGKTVFKNNVFEPLAQYLGIQGNYTKQL